MTPALIRFHSWSIRARMLAVALLVSIAFHVLLWFVFSELYRGKPPISQVTDPLRFSISVSTSSPAPVPVPSDEIQTEGKDLPRTQDVPTNRDPSDADTRDTGRPSTDGNNRPNETEISPSAASDQEPLASSDGKANRALGAGQPSEKKLELPKQLELSFSAAPTPAAPQDDQALLKWTHVGDTYSIELIVGAKSNPLLGLKSEGQITLSGLHPLTFTQNIRGLATSSFEVNPAYVHGSINIPRQDVLSALLQVAITIINDPARYAIVKQIEIPTRSLTANKLEPHASTPFDRLVDQVHRFTFDNETDVALPAANIRVRPTSALLEHEFTPPVQIPKAWLATQFQYLPARLTLDFQARTAAEQGSKVRTEIDLRLTKMP